MRQPGKKLSERDELGDLDKTQWELGPDGQSKDPWQNTRFVYLVDPVSAEAYTFVTASWGGRQAVNDLAEQIQRMRHARPGASPLVELQAEPWLTRFGRKSKPCFKVVEWRGGGPRNGDPTPALALVEDKTDTSAVTPRGVDDHIPF